VVVVVVGGAVVGGAVVGGAVVVTDVVVVGGAVVGGAVVGGAVVVTDVVVVVGGAVVVTDVGGAVAVGVESTPASEQPTATSIAVSTMPSRRFPMVPLLRCEPSMTLRGTSLMHGGASVLPARGLLP
jgi:hypothetical protein